MTVRCDQQPRFRKHGDICKREVEPAPPWTGFIRNATAEKVLRKPSPLSSRPNDPARLPAGLRELEPDNRLMLRRAGVQRVVRRAFGSQA